MLYVTAVLLFCILFYPDMFYILYVLWIYGTLNKLKLKFGVVMCHQIIKIIKLEELNKYVFV
jgi:hypothetical protein